MRVVGKRARAAVASGRDWSAMLCFNARIFTGIRAYKSLKALSTAAVSMNCNATTTATGARKSEGTSGKIHANGVDLYFERYGSGPHAVLCMPGALGSVQTDFPPQMDYFGRPGSGFTVVGYDPRGYGRSRPHSRRYSAPGGPLFYETDAEDAAGVMRGLGYSEFSLVGWSDGGVSAIIAAARFPKLVKNLVVWGANAYVSKTDVELVEKTRNVANWSPRMRAAMEAVYGGDFPRMWSDWMDGFVGVYFDPVRKGDLCKKEAGEVKCPTLVVHGEKDALCPKFHAEFLSNEIPNCRYVTYPEGKHNLHLKYSEEFNKLVGEFLKGS